MEENTKQLDSQEEQKLKEKSLKLSNKESAAASVMSGSGDAYITPYALALGATNSQIGFLSSFVGLFGALSQIIGSRAIYKFSKKKIVVISSSLQAFMWLVMMTLGLLVWKEIITSQPAIILIILYTITVVFANFGGPAWFSWMGDLVPEEKRGNYFSRKSRISNTVIVSATLLTAFLLDYTKAIGLVLVGFSIASLISATGRFISAYLLTKQYEPKTEIKKESYFSFIQFLKKASGNNYGKFVFYVGSLVLATNFAAPFFSVYMLKELHYSYAWFMVVNISGTLFTIISIPFLGKIGDKYGNKALLKIGGIVVVFNPLFWVVSGNPIYLILTAQLCSGIGWAAFNLGAGNYIYDAVTPQRRAICVAYFTMINGVGVFIGASLGGLFIEYINIDFMNIFLLVFIISAILRGIVSLIFLPMIKEVRPNAREQKTKEVLKYAGSLIPNPFNYIFKNKNNK